MERIYRRRKTTATLKNKIKNTTFHKKQQKLKNMEFDKNNIVVLSKIMFDEGIELSYPQIDCFFVDDKSDLPFHNGLKIRKLTGQDKGVYYENDKVNIDFENDTLSITTIDMYTCAIKEIEAQSKQQDLLIVDGKTYPQNEWLDELPSTIKIDDLQDKMDQANNQLFLKAYHEAQIQAEMIRQ